MLIFNEFGHSLPTPKTMAQFEVRAMSLFFPSGITIYRVFQSDFFLLLLFSKIHKSLINLSKIENNL